MNKNWYLNLLILSLYCTVNAGSNNAFSINVNLGLSTIGHQSQALLIQNFDEIGAYEVLDNFRGADNTNSAYTKLSTKHALGKVIREVFVQEDKAGKPWENTTRTAYLPPVVLSSDLTTLYINDATLLTGTPGTPSFSGTKTPTTAIVTDTGLSFDTASMTKYTVPGSTLDSGLPSTSAFIVSTDSFHQLKNLKDEILPTIQSSSNYIKAQKNYQTLDGGLNLAYDIDGNIHMFTTLSIHYPIDFIPKETVSIISYTPHTTYDISIGTLINYNRGRFGGSFGISQIAGDFVLNKYNRLAVLSDDNSDGSAVTNLEYIDYLNSYNNGADSIRVKNVSDLFFFGEIRAETLPTTESGLILYSSYKIGFGRQDENAILSKLDLKQDSITVGASVCFFSTAV